MGQLCIYLPPFTSDYSGVCSALFDLDCMTAINDASCCTSHYVYYDEPRWNTKIRPIFSTALRNIDAVLGNDNKVIDNIIEAFKQLDTKMISIVGTPVPAIIGMDMVGIANDIEYQTGKPTFGFNTTGFNYYDKGIIQVGKTLIDRFAKPMDKVAKRINIVGMTPIDYGINGNDEDLVTFINESGFEVGCHFFMGMSVNQIEKCASSSLNIAVSSSGIELSKYMNKKFNIPYSVGFPMGLKYKDVFVDELLFAKQFGTKLDLNTNNKLLIVTDQVIGNSIRRLMRLHGADFVINVASFFEWDSNIAEADDIHFKEESDYLKLIKSGKYSAVCGDKMMFDIPHMDNILKFELVHPAISSKIGWDKDTRFMTTDFDNFIVSIINTVAGK